MSKNSQYYNFDNIESDEKSELYDANFSQDQLQPLSNISSSSSSSNSLIEEFKLARKKFLDLSERLRLQGINPDTITDEASSVSYNPFSFLNDDFKLSPEPISTQPESASRLNYSNDENNSQQPNASGFVSNLALLSSTVAVASSSSSSSQASSSAKSDIEDNKFSLQASANQVEKFLDDLFFSCYDFKDAISAIKKDQTLLQAINPNKGNKNILEMLLTLPNANYEISQTIIIKALFAFGININYEAISSKSITVKAKRNLFEEFRDIDQSTAIKMCDRFEEKAKIRTKFLIVNLFKTAENHVNALFCCLEAHPTLAIEPLNSKKDTVKTLLKNSTLCERTKKRAIVKLKSFITENLRSSEQYELDCRSLSSSSSSSTNHPALGPYTQKIMKEGENVRGETHKRLAGDFLENILAAPPTKKTDLSQKDSNETAISKGL